MRHKDQKPQRYIPQKSRERKYSCSARWAASAQVVLPDRAYLPSVICYRVIKTPPPPPPLFPVTGDKLPLKYLIQYVVHFYHNGET